jgi:hypothetical protein
MKDPKPPLIDLSTEQTRAEMRDGIDWGAFLERTRRYQRLTKNPPSNTHYARGLDSKQSDFA